ncbi:hypothetical protein ACTXT7_011677 [Hymenolepis weldensis]
MGFEIIKFSLLSLKKNAKDAFSNDIFEEAPTKSVNTKNDILIRGVSTTWTFKRFKTTRYRTLKVLITYGSTAECSFELELDYNLRDMILTLWRNSAGVDNK